MVRPSSVVALPALVIVWVLSSAAAPVAPSGTAAVTYVAPAPLRVLRPFEAPPTPFGPGHRGVDLATRAGEAVHAAGAGVVIFAGAVAGRGVVVLQHPDGVSTEYEPITA